MLPSGPSWYRDGPERNTESGPHSRTSMSIGLVPHPITGSSSRDRLLTWGRLDPGTHAIRAFLIVSQGQCHVDGVYAVAKMQREVGYPLPIDVRTKKTQIRGGQRTESWTA